MSFSDEDKVTFAALALYDGGSEITADNLKALITASGNTTAPYWPALFSGLLKGDTIEKIINSAGSGGAAAPAAAAGAPAAGDAPAAKKEEKQKVEEVDALDGGMDMFGG
jgi:ribosomal protein L12E/L44/L45/RPP1/RPP2